MGKGIDLESLAMSEARAAAYAGDIQDTYEALKFLNTLENKRWPTSFYVNDIATRFFLARGKEPRDFLIRWIEQNEDDERTALLVSGITDSFMRERPPGYLDLVLPYLESLVDGKYAEPLMKIDGTGISQGNSGNYAMALHNIVEIYKTKKEYDKAIQYNNRLLEMFPNYGGLTASAKLDTAILAQRKEAQENEEILATLLASPWTPVKIARTVFLVLGIAICAYVFYRKFRRRTKMNMSQ